MKRRTLFGLPLVGLFGLWPRPAAAEPLLDATLCETLAAPLRPQEPFPVPPAAPLVDPRSRPAPFGPTMLTLLCLAEYDRKARGDYDRLLSLALRETGPVCDCSFTECIVYHAGGIPAAPFGHLVTRLPKASNVPVPESLLPYFRPDDRGEEFPRGVPYRRMP